MNKIICRYIKDSYEKAIAMNIRKKVFVDEQELFAVSDEDPFDEKAIHLVAELDGTIVGTVRLYNESGDTWVGGRLAVLIEFRGRVGARLVERAVQEAVMQGAKLFKADVQIQNENFFKRLGWETVEKNIFICGVEHVRMTGPLNAAVSRASAGLEKAVI